MNGALQMDEHQQARPPIDAAMQPASKQARPPRQLIIGAVLLLHAAAVALIVKVTAVDSRVAEPKEFLFTAVGLLMAYCSLCGIWWARSLWQLKVKTPVAVLAC